MKFYHRHYGPLDVGPQNDGFFWFCSAAPLVKTMSTYGNLYAGVWTEEEFKDLKDGGILMPVA